jgi:ParB family chromosome partitioning protein
MNKKRGSDKFTGQTFEGSEKKAHFHPLSEITIGARLTVREIELDLIDRNPNQPRVVFDDLEYLANSIKAKGVISPIALRRIGKRYQIIFGERRWRASKIADIKKIPAIIYDDYEDIEETSLIENLQRKDLSPVEESLAIHKLISKKNLKQKEVALMIGKTESYVSQAVKIAKFVEKHNNKEELINLKTVNGTKLGREHFLSAASQSSFEEGVNLLNQIVNGHMTVRKVRHHVRNNNPVWDSKKMRRHLKSVRNTLKVNFIDKLSVNDNKESVLEDIEMTQSELRNTIKALEDAKRKILNGSSSDTIMDPKF